MAGPSVLAGASLPPHEEHRVPHSDRVLGILKEMQELQQNDLVFPGSKQGRPLSNMSLLMLLRELRPGITTYGFGPRSKIGPQRVQTHRTSCPRRRWPTLSPIRWRQPIGALISLGDAGDKWTRGTGTARALLPMSWCSSVAEAEQA